MEPLQLEPGEPGDPKKQPVTQQHKRVPRWLRMALRIGILCCLVALPALAVKEPSFERLFKYKNYSIIFLVLGTMVRNQAQPQQQQAQADRTAAADARRCCRCGSPYLATSCLPSRSSSQVRAPACCGS